MDKNKIREDLNNSIVILECNLELFNQGRKEVYIVIANELRKLICDRNINSPNAKDNSLLLKIFTVIKLFPIKDSNKKPEPNLIAKPYGTMKFNGQGDYKIIDFFDEKRPKIILEAWFKEPMMFVNERITLEEFIKSVSDKEGVHSDNFYNKTIQQIKHLKVGDTDTRRHYIAAIGEYILKEIKENTQSLVNS